jgi:hypothetical protein
MLLMLEVIAKGAIWCLEHAERRTWSRQIQTLHVCQNAAA